MTNQIKEKAPLILAEIKKAKSVLLHCHPSPDSDSVGSALAMKLAVEQLGGKAEVIKGDSDIPEAFMHFPGAKDILMKSFWEIDPNDYDLFIIVDSDLKGVSRTKFITELPEKMMVINIDHHRTNTGSGKINIIEPTYPAVGQLLYDIFIEMGISITPEIATNLFMGIYSDTGGFKYEGTNPDTFHVAGELSRMNSEMYKVIAQMENDKSLDDMKFQALALSCLETETAGDIKVLLSVISLAKIEGNHIPKICISTGMISYTLKTVAGFDIYAVIVQDEINRVKISLRTSDSEKYDVSKVAQGLGGGGHKAASGITMNISSIDEAKERLILKIKELYNDKPINNQIL